MRTMCAAFGAMALASAMVGQQPANPAGGVLSAMSWQEAEPVLSDSAVVVIPLGAASVEFGPHMKLNTGEQIARYLASRVQAARSIVIAPPLTYYYSPAYVEYPGTASLSRNTARDETVDVVRSLARYGPRRFYALNTGGTSAGPLSDAAKVLADSGILLGWTDMRYHLANAPITRQQRSIAGAPHADEIETSIMLAIDPSSVDMTKAVAEYGTGTGPLTRKQDGPGIFSRTGVLGDPTVASVEKGRVLVDALVAAVLDDIDKLRFAALPIAKPVTPSPPPPAALPPPTERRMPNGCTAGEERTIREIGSRFSSLWRQMDATGISSLFSTEADIRHPDGTIERTRDVIRQNRELLFQKREYRGSVHPVTLYDVRCLGPNHAIADGKWELRYVDTPGSGPLGRGSASTSPTYSGLCTLVLSGSGSGWVIEAWRYTVNPPEGVPPPTTLKQPGFVGRGF